jgi:hypothetical protein
LLPLCEHFEVQLGVSLPVGPANKQLDRKQSRQINRCSGSTRIMVRIWLRIRRSVPLNYGSGSYFIQDADSESAIPIHPIRKRFSCVAHYLL